MELLHQFAPTFVAHVDEVGHLTLGLTVAADEYIIIIVIIIIIKIVIIIITIIVIIIIIITIIIIIIITCRRFKFVCVQFASSAMCV